MAANKYSGADALRKFWDRISGHIVAINNRLDDVPDQGDVDELKAAITRKIEKPTDAPAVGKVLKIKSVNEDGSFVCKWAEDVEGQATDVQINGTSITENGVANIPYGSNSKRGVVQGNSDDFGVGVNASGLVYLQQASENMIGTRSDAYHAITPKRLNPAVKAALTDSNKMVLSDTEKAVACETIGADTTLWDTVEVTIEEASRIISIYCGENVREMRIFMIVPPFAYKNINARMSVLTKLGGDPYGFVGSTFNNASSAYNAYKSGHIVIAGDKMAFSASEKYNLSIQVGIVNALVGIGKVQPGDMVVGARLITYDNEDKFPIGTKVTVVWR